MDDFPAPRFIDVNGVRLATYEALPETPTSTPPIVLVHGWPEIAYSWRDQLKALAKAGRRAIALDVRGFGASDAPTAHECYDIHHLTDDLAGLLDAYEIPQAIFCGHDWGGAQVWPMAQRHRDRVAGVIGVCTPHVAPPPAPPLDILEKRLTDKYYIIQFQEEGVAEALFTGEEEKFFRIMFRPAGKRENWSKLGVRLYDLPGRFRHGGTPSIEECILSADELNVYISAYKKSGFHGGINLYRNITRNYELMKDVDPVLTVPGLWIGAEDDPFLPPENAAKMDALVPDLEKRLIADCGHWVMWEQPEALNTLILDWLDRRFA